jgi:hypothetical protein
MFSNADRVRNFNYTVRHGHCLEISNLHYDIIGIELC